MLVTKCKCYNFHNIIIRWFCESQRARLGQELSDWVSLKGSVPQGEYLWHLLFIVLIDDLHPPCIMHKYMDDTTFTVKLQKGSSSSMQTHMNQAAPETTTGPFFDVKWLSVDAVKIVLQYNNNNKVRNRSHSPTSFAARSVRGSYSTFNHHQYIHSTTVLPAPAGESSRIPRI